MADVQSLMSVLLASESGLPPVATDGFFVFIIIMTTVSVLLLLLLVIMLTVKMSQVMKQLDEISTSANDFLSMGVKFFKDKQHH